MRYFLSLGSNLGAKRKNLVLALKLLEEAGVKLVRTSSLFRTQPVGMTQQPWFYNLVVEVSTLLSPKDLLHLIKTTEKALGRKPSRVKGPRQVDIDILLAGDLVMDTRELIIPHPRMTERNFVLVPLAEISPGIVHPLSRTSIKTLLDRSRDTSVVRKLGPAKGKTAPLEGTGGRKPN